MSLSCGILEIRENIENESGAVISKNRNGTNSFGYIKRKNAAN